MAPQAMDANGVLFEGDAETEDVALANPPIQQAGDEKWDFRYVKHILFYTAMLYTAGVYGGYLALVSTKWQTNVFCKILYSVINWARDHRMHHKYVDTDADPHNATRGLFFSHVGWLMVEKHPEFERKSKQIDLSDLESNPILHFQQKYYVALVTVICFILPTVIPVYFWNETWINAFFVPVLLHHVCCFNVTALVNSALHKWGYKPYDKNMMATELKILDPFTLGENYHNYHHAFPWDYKAAEVGEGTFLLSTAFINFFAKIGWAYDLKTISDDVIRKRVIRTGDGSHHIWGWGDKDQTKEEVDAAVRINPKED
ncbi:acyl-CoA Delta-9 desaturase-like [Leguminivora glycinivorella]|uniref:acyl-CoA Delta-9 desaturase-like n=1 Tax=Leguminivora glycinivorella TaxID=1035111 RepID=UPI00200C4D11|nr:acyl-CoA Delta-9 desaturase-like [Leguminivora glycinivorella]